MAQQRVAEQTVAGGPGVPQRGALEPEQQHRQRRRLFGVPLIEHQPQRVQRRKLGQQEQRPGKEGEHVVAGGAGHCGQRGGQQLGEVVVVEPHPRKADVLGREGAEKRLGVAHVPQQVLLRQNAAGRRRVGVAGAEAERKKQAQRAPQNRQQPYPGRQRAAPPPGQRLAGQGGAPLPPGQRQRRRGRQEPVQPGLPQPHPGAEAGGQQRAAVHGGQKRGQAGGMGPEPAGQQPAGQHKIPGRGGKKAQRRGKVGAAKGDHGQVAGQAEAGQQPGQAGRTAGSGRRGKRRGSVRGRYGGRQGRGPPLGRLGTMCGAGGIAGGRWQRDHLIPLPEVCPAGRETMCFPAGDRSSVQGECFKEVSEWK